MSTLLTFAGPDPARARLGRVGRAVVADRTHRASRLRWGGRAALRGEERIGRELFPITNSRRLLRKAVSCPSTCTPISGSTWRTRSSTCLWERPPGRRSIENKHSHLTEGVPTSPRWRWRPHTSTCATSMSSSGERNNGRPSRTHRLTRPTPRSHHRSGRSLAARYMRSCFIPIR